MGAYAEYITKMGSIYLQQHVRLLAHVRGGWHSKVQ